MGHGHHHHHHDTNNQSTRQLMLAVAINVLLTVAQVIGGLVSGSLSLIADALHNLSDASSLFIALIARKIGAKPANDRYQYGYKRAEILATLFNSLSLIVIGGYLIIEAISNYLNPEPIDGWIIIWVAGLALIIDLVTALLTYKAGAKDSMNIRAAFIHNVSDALASVVVIIAGTLIILYQWYIVDLIATMLISLYVIYHGVLLLIASSKILMQAAPDNFALAAATTELKTQFAITDIDYLKTWQIDDHHVHCELKFSAKHNINNDEIRHFLHDNFAIESCTIEQVLV